MGSLAGRSTAGVRRYSLGGGALPPSSSLAQPPSSRGAPAPSASRSTSAGVSLQLHPFRRRVAEQEPRRILAQVADRAADLADGPVDVLDQPLQLRQPALREADDRRADLTDERGQLLG